MSAHTIAIVTPQEPTALTGNVFTAERYAVILRRLGHRVEIVPTDATDLDSEVLVALHARRSHGAVGAFRSRFPDRPIVLVLTGTDLYRDIQHDASAQRSLVLADRLVVLQSMGVRELPDSVRPKAWVIYQSAPMLRARVAKPKREFRVIVVGHLRAEKDPLRAALASRTLPPASRIRVLHVGGVLAGEYEELAREEMTVNPRYRWMGELPHGKTRRLLAGSHLLVISSLMEGSSNILCEALAQPTPTPVLASRISGLMGTLGEDYPGYFAVGDTEALTDLLWRAESDRAFYRGLSDGCERAAPLVQPDHELACWADLLADLAL